METLKNPTSDPTAVLRLHNNISSQIYPANSASEYLIARLIFRQHFTNNTLNFAHNGNK